MLTIASSSSKVVAARWVARCAVGLLGVLVIQADGWAAETAEPSATSTTRIVLKLDTEEPVEVRTTFQEHPPALTLEFPRQRVAGSLPERSAIREGPLQAITTRYDMGGAPPRRFIQSLQIALSGPYAYHVSSAPGRVIIDIDHPASVERRAMEVGLKGGTIIGGMSQPQLGGRFLAMQNALNEAMASRRPSARPREAISAGPGTTAPSEDQRRAAAPQAPIGAGGAPPSSQQARAPALTPALAGLGTIAALIALGGLWLASRRQRFKALWRRAPSAEPGARRPSGVSLVDELVWQAFERQGYQLVKAVELIRPSGTLRLIAKDGAKAALVFVWNGLFFEKRTVEQFAKAMREVNVETGFLVASGSFTVPAQRVAKERRITLIGREQLMELLSAGATSEYFSKQLEQAQTRLEESKETLRQYATQLDTLRRQRNEASWYLGEERAKSGTLEAQFAELEVQLRHHEAELARWQQEAARVRKQWEESQWYLGESRARLHHLEAQLAALQELAAQVEPAQRGLDEANWYLGEERTARQALEVELKAVQQALEESRARERTLQAALEQLTREVSAIQVYGERRRGIRKRVSQALVELHNGQPNASPVVSGVLRDLSSTGVGLEMDGEIPLQRNLHLRVSHPTLGEPIESKARVVWQQAGGEPPRYQSGCRFIGLSDTTRSLIEQLIARGS